MKRIIVILLVVAVGAYFAYSHFEGKAKERHEKQAKEERIKKRQNAVRSNVTKMASKFGAIDDWERKLQEKRKGNTFKIWTIELEKLWLTDQPILFRGFIKDIYSIDRNTYSMSLDKQIDLFADEPYLDTELALSLKCPKTMIDSFLNAHPTASLSEDTDFNGVAVIAKINKIESSSWHRSESVDSSGDLNDKEMVTKIGIGECLDIFYTGED
jgi:hypothetical protein